MENKIKVIIQYVGVVDLSYEVPASMAIQALKVKAMEQFELEVGKSDKYSLQYEGADISVHKKVGDFGQDELVLKLVPIGELTKGII
ncbi:hypothetical protein RZN22_13475 [Bacillaceae bacterium S4-13-58]